MRNYEQENKEILLLFQKQMRKFTSGESTSLTYETGERLMKGLEYILEEGMQMSEQEDCLSTEENSLQFYFERGKSQIYKKVMETKMIYDELLSDFQDYGCQNYDATIRRGFPAFFLRYDPLFFPQNHILSLDYPVLLMNQGDKGIDLILDYAKKIKLEFQFLRLFHSEEIIELMREKDANYRKQWMGNLAEPVLLRTAAFCILGKRPDRLLLYPEEREWIKTYFLEKSYEELKNEILQSANSFFEKTTLSCKKNYFLAALESEIPRVHLCLNQMNPTLTL